MENSPNLTLPYIAASQAQKHVTHNEALRQLDALVQLSVDDDAMIDAPQNVQNGQRFIVPQNATGSWQGKQTQIAAFQDGAWAYYVPQTGWLAWVESKAELQVYRSENWEVASSGASEQGGGATLGVNANADDTNRLAVKSDAVLLSHDDVTPGSGDIRTSLNKAAEDKTASLLFQTNYLGHSEIGLTGNNDLSIKVSPDGNQFKTALQINKDTAELEVQRLKSGQFVVSKNGGLAEIPVPSGSAGGLVALCSRDAAWPQVGFSAIYAYDVGSSLYLVSLIQGPSLHNMGTVVLDGTNGQHNKVNISAQTGKLIFANQHPSMNLTMGYTFIC